MAPSPPPRAFMAVSYSLFSPPLTMMFHVAWRKAAPSTRRMIEPDMMPSARKFREIPEHFAGETLCRPGSLPAKTR